MNLLTKLSLFALLAGSFPVSAQAPEAAATEPPERTTSAIVYGDDPCPAAPEGEIVVCARRPEGDRYRIPKDLRNADDPPSEVAWGARSQLLEEAGRANLPGSCNAVGTYGQTGCQQKIIDQWYRERRALRR